MTVCTHICILTEARTNTVQIQLPSGRTITIRREITPERLADLQADKVKSYFSQVLELGLCFRNFHQAYKVPHRLRMIRTMKLMMVLIRGQSPKSSYPDEILRFVVLQQCVYSPREAQQMFAAMQVNTRGKQDSNIPVDLQMEYIVKSSKRHIGHMQSNKSQTNIERKTGALAAINQVMEKYDESTETLIRSKKHTHTSALADELSMVEDLRTVRPFQHQAGRSYPQFDHIKPTLIHEESMMHLRQWMLRRGHEHAASLVN